MGPMPSVSWPSVTNRVHRTKPIPRPQTEYKGSTCLGLVHAETFEYPAKIVYMCDARNANP